MSAIGEMYEKYGVSQMYLGREECGENRDGYPIFGETKYFKTLEDADRANYTVLDDEPEYAPLTTEKQLELLKTIGLLGNVCITKRVYNDMWCITTHHKNGIGQDLVFEEALSKWITNIYDYLSVTMQNKVKEILER